MKSACYGRMVFGASAVLFGVIALMWRDIETWQECHYIWKLPFGLAIGMVLMAAQIAAGIALQIPRLLRPSATTLGVVYMVFSLGCIPSIFSAPNVYGSYAAFFEQFSLFSGAMALYAASEANAAKAAVISRLARLALGVSTISFTLAQAVYLRPTASLVPKWIPPNQTFWAILTTVAFGLAAIAILINRRARLALRLMTLMLALFGVLIWIPHVAAHPEAHLNWSEMALTFLIMGVAWVMADSVASHEW